MLISKIWLKFTGICTFLYIIEVLFLSEILQKIKIKVRPVYIHLQHYDLCLTSVSLKSILQIPPLFS